ncbi:McrC family protein [Haliea sp. E17]|uniref:McrC family protein n=1 Tax=Haliea sp. E17 TaxID=3401576 RepID=UPI003AADEBE2
MVTYDTSRRPDIDTAVVEKATFDWLLELQGHWKGEGALLRLVNRRALRLENYVGYLESPAGEGIEILPKTEQRVPSDATLKRSRTLLRRMLAATSALSPREADAAVLERSDDPLHEWVIGCYLSELKELVRRGLRFDYLDVEEETTHLRGRLLLERQLRQPPSRQHRFQIRHQLYTPNRRENRLLRNALDIVLRLTHLPEHWRLANELRHQLNEIVPYREPLKELPRWAHNKLMRHYAAIRPWCSVVLEQLNPDFQRGQYRGIAMLYPMERLFEGYVASQFRQSLAGQGRLRTQVSRHSLVHHQPEGAAEPQPWFRLKPDLVYDQCDVRIVMDTKWKLIDGNKASSSEKYELSQADFYQLAAYGEKYLEGEGHLLLIYPAYQLFSSPLPAFRFREKLVLWVVPFDLEKGVLISGAWCDAVPALLPTTVPHGRGTNSVPHSDQAA